MFERPKDIAAKYGVSQSTLRRWLRDGKIRGVKTAGGQNRFEFNEQGAPPEEKARRRVAYCRVSSAKQKDDLERQKRAFARSHPEHEVIWDIGSGLNYKRPKFLGLVDAICTGRIEEVVVAHRDRLCRFSFELIEWLCTKNGASLVVLDQEIRSAERELSEDLMAIVHVFSCRHHGMRRYERKNGTGGEAQAVTDTSANQRLAEMDEGGEADLQQSTAPGENQETQAQPLPEEVGGDIQ